MQLGFVSAVLYDLKLEDVFRVASEESYECVEVMCWPGSDSGNQHAGVCHIDVAEFTKSRADDVNALAEKYQVSLSALGYYPNPLSADAEEAETARDHLRRVFEAAPKLGLTTVNTFIGADHTQPLEVNLARFEAVWPDLVRFAEQCGVRLGIENCPMLFSAETWPFGKNLARSPSVWRQMFKAIPSPNFGLNYDPSHLVMQLMDYVAPVDAFRDRIFHTHAKDMKIDRRRLDDHGILDLKWCTPKIPGLGDIQWGRWISALTDIGYDGPVCVEVEDEAFLGDLSARRRALRISRDAIRPLLG